METSLTPSGVRRYGRGKMRNQIELGALAPKLSEQLRELGMQDEKIMIRFEIIADALTVCAVHGIIPPSQIDKGRDKLVRRIRAGLASSPPRP
jgi:hypothetical protein